MFEEDTIKFLIADLQSVFLSRIQGLPLCVNCDERETKLQLRRQQQNVLVPHFQFSTVSNK